MPSNPSDDSKFLEHHTWQCFAHVREYWKERNERLISEAFAKTTVNEVASESFIVFDDTLILFLSLHIQAPTLKAHGFKKWHRLSNCPEFAPMLEKHIRSADVKRMFRVVVWMAQSPQSLHSLLDLILKMDGFVSSDHSIAIYICFVPARRCFAVAKLIEGMKRQMTSVDIRTDSLIVTKGLRVHLIDTHLRLCCLDNSAYSMNIASAHKRLMCEGDLMVINELVVAIREMMRTLKVCKATPLWAVGTWGLTLAEMLKRYAKAPEGDGQGFPPDQQRNSPFHRVEEMLRAYEACNDLLAADRKHCTSLDSPRPTLSTTRGRKQIENLLCPANRPLTSILTGSRLTKSMYLTAVSNSTRASPAEAINFSEFLSKDAMFCSHGNSEIKDKIITRIESPSFRVYLPSEEKGVEEETICKQADLRKFSLASIVLIDRQFDMLSPFITPFTYEALIDLVWPSDANHALIPGEIIAENSTDLRLRLGDSTRIYRDLRDLPHVALGTSLHDMAIKMQSLFQTERKRDWTVKELKVFIDELKKQHQDHKELTQHIQIVTHVINRVVKHPVFYTLLKIEDGILSGSLPAEEVTKVLAGLCERNYPVVDILRLAVLSSNLRRSNFSCSKALFQSIAQAYGPFEASRLSYLEQAQIYKNGDTSSQNMTWDSVNEILKCIQSDQAKIQAGCRSRDISYVHSGYAPLSVRLVQMLTEDPRKVLQTFDKGNGGAMTVKRHELISQIDGKPQMECKQSEEITLVVFIGGATRSELSALRELSKMHSPKRAYLALCTEVFGYRDFLEAFKCDEPINMHPTYVAPLNQSPYTHLLEKCM